MDIFVTGGSGFVGAATIARLATGGHRVRAMSRSGTSDATVRAAGAEPVRCDLENVDARHLVGAEVVVHAAAFVEAWGPVDAWERINVNGTRRMLEAARDAGVGRFVHIGTEAALVHGQALRDADESYPLALDSPYPYCRTKARAEQAVLAASDAANGFVTLVLRPRFIWGPGDRTLLPAILTAARAGQWTWVDRGRALTSTTYIGNLVDAIELVLTRGRPGEAYFILDDGTRSLHEMVGALAGAAGVTLPEKSMPYGVAHALGAVLEFCWRALRLAGAPPLTRHAAMVMGRECTLVDNKARREIGYKPRVTVADGLIALRDSLAASQTAAAPRP
jgi:nucleoside-diphosphate-sugar epimerase